MKWLLVVLVMNTPLKTDLVFDTLDACLSAEAQMRAAWAETYNRAVADGAEQDTLRMIERQMTHGTCIPSQ